MKASMSLSRKRRRDPRRTQGIKGSERVAWSRTNCGETASRSATCSAVKSEFILGVAPAVGLIPAVHHMPI
jgi:hypothetical protein